MPKEERYPVPPASVHGFVAPADGSGMVTRFAPAKIGDGRDPLPHAWSSDGNSLVARTVAGALSIAVGRPLL